MNNEHDATRIGELEREVSSLRDEIVRSRRTMRNWFLLAFVLFALRDAFLGRNFWGFMVLASPIVPLGYLILWWSDCRIEALKNSRGMDFEPAHAERMNPSKLFTSQQPSQGL